VKFSLWNNRRLTLDLFRSNISTQGSCNVMKMDWPLSCLNLILASTLGLLKQQQNILICFKRLLILQVCYHNSSSIKWITSFSFTAISCMTAEKGVILLQQTNLCKHKCCRVAVLCGLGVESRSTERLFPTGLLIPSNHRGWSLPPKHNNLGSKVIEVTPHRRYLVAGTEPRQQAVPFEVLHIYVACPAQQ